MDEKVIFLWRVMGHHIVVDYSLIRIVGTQTVWKSAMFCT